MGWPWSEWQAVHSLTHISSLDHFHPRLSNLLPCMSIFFLNRSLCNSISSLGRLVNITSSFSSTAASKNGANWLFVLSGQSKLNILWKSRPSATLYHRGHTILCRAHCSWAVNYILERNAIDEAQRHDYFCCPGHSDGTVKVTLLLLLLFLLPSS